VKRNILSRLLCPYREYTLETRLTKEQVLGTMRARTERKDRIFRFPKGKIYVGDVDDNGFCVAVSKSFFNQVSQVQITAHITESNSGSLISVRIKLSEPVFTFMMVWLSGCLLFTVLTAGLLISGHAAFSFGVFVPLILLVFGFCLMNLILWLRSPGVLNQLAQLLMAKDMQQNLSPNNH